MSQSIKFFFFWLLFTIGKTSWRVHTLLDEMKILMFCDKMCRHCHIFNRIIKSNTLMSRRASWYNHYFPFLIRSICYEILREFQTLLTDYVCMYVWNKNEFYSMYGVRTFSSIHQPPPPPLQSHINSDKRKSCVKILSSPYSVKIKCHILFMLNVLPKLWYGNGKQY